jgi:hypothetical protein
MFFKNIPENENPKIIEDINVKSQDFFEKRKKNLEPKFPYSNLGCKSSNRYI